MPEKQCACGMWMDNVHGVWLCAHDDRDCDAAKPCGLCTKYNAATQLRINNAARTEPPTPRITIIKVERPDDPPKPADG